MTTGQEWKKLYQTAVLETDWSKLEERIRAAELAIEKRKADLAHRPAGTPEEIKELTDAMKGLTTLRADAASWQKRELS